ncbi:MAG: endolytic transglycosylase MltG [Candidatus Nomurabacteria bacterium]|nr:endolytic transglycosylase MltG [Candidatus Nomurabacteria bacterium]
MDENIDTIRPKNKILNIWILSIFIIIVLTVFYFLSAPFKNSDVLIHISSGRPLRSISSELIKDQAIRSDLTLKIFIKLLGTKKGIISGDYLIKKNSPVWIVAWQISRGHHNVEPIKVTLKEGITKNNMAKILADKIPNFNTDLFLNDPRSKEGYLFPDTYFFYSLSSTDEIITDITANFQKRINSIDKDIKSGNHSLSDIITMASILEKEAGGKNDIAIISGILWKRIQLGMPLQVDAAPDTYRAAGLPESPIGNPGLLSIKAALHPQVSGYLFYLHDKEGNVHYAVDFNEHRSNIVKYLK